LDWLLYNSIEKERLMVKVILVRWKGSKEIECSCVTNEDSLPAYLKDIQNRLVDSDYDTFVITPGTHKELCEEIDDMLKEESK
jgi:hypothetical protein